MEKEAQKPQIAPPRINDIDQVLKELRIDSETPNQAHLPTHKVSLTKKEYISTEAMEKVKNIATLKQVMMDEDFLERCQNAKIDSFLISPKAIPQEFIDALKSLDVDDSVCFRIDRKEGTLNPVSESQFDKLNPNYRGALHRTVLEVIRIGGTLHIFFSSTARERIDIYGSPYKIPYRVAFVESTY